MCVGGGAERWLDRVKEEEGVGTVLMQLFRRSTRNACDVRIHKEELQITLPC